MSNQSGDKQLTELNRSQIARAIFAAAESMGMADRHQIEQLTAQVIERLERQQPLPGMEELVPQPRRQQRRSPTKPEIQAIVKEILRMPFAFWKEGT